MEPDVKVQTETASGERIWTGIAGMESRSAKGISRWCKESGFHGRFGLFAGKRNKIRDTATSDLEARKGKKKGLRGGETNCSTQSSETQFPGCQADTGKNRKTGGGRSAECSLFCCRQRIHGYSGYISNQNCKENSTNL